MNTDRSERNAKIMQLHSQGMKYRQIAYEVRDFMAGREISAARICQILKSMKQKALS